MTLGETLEAAFPFASRMGFFEVSGEGDAQVISYWNEGILGPQPNAAGIVVSIPNEVTPRQARLALLNAGLLDSVEAAVATAGGAAQITWDYATIISRHDPLIETLGADLNLTAEQIDALFAQAARLFGTGSTADPTPGPEGRPPPLGGRRRRDAQTSQPAPANFRNFRILGDTVATEALAKSWESRSLTVVYRSGRKCQTRPPTGNFYSVNERSNFTRVRTISIAFRM